MREREKRNYNLHWKEKNGHYFCRRYFHSSLANTSKWWISEMMTTFAIICNLLWVYLLLFFRSLSQSGEQEAFKVYTGELIIFSSVIFLLVVIVVVIFFCLLLTTRHKKYKSIFSLFSCHFIRGEYKSWAINQPSVSNGLQPFASTAAHRARERDWMHECTSERANVRKRKREFEKESVQEK